MSSYELNSHTKGTAMGVLHPIFLRKRQDMFDTNRSFNRDVYLVAWSSRLVLMLRHPGEREREQRSRAC